MTRKSKSQAPWKRANPRKRAGKAIKHLSATQKTAAKALAERAGRPYPNLVDNMRVAKSVKKMGVRKSVKTIRGKAKKAVKTGTSRSTIADQKDSKGD
jgi:hypothetical protein